MSMDYSQNRWNVIDQLSVMDVIEPMTKEEEQKFNENPTLINAVKTYMPKEEQKNIVIVDSKLERLENDEILIKFILDSGKTSSIKIGKDSNVLEENGFLANIPHKEKLLLIKTVLVNELAKLYKAEKNVSDELENNEENNNSKKELIDFYGNELVKLASSESELTEAEKEYKLKRK